MFQVVNARTRGFIGDADDFETAKKFAVNYTKKQVRAGYKLAEYSCVILKEVAFIGEPEAEIKVTTIK